MTHLMATGPNRRREKNVWHFTKTVRGSNLQNHRSILNNKHYRITRSVSKKEENGTLEKWAWHELLRMLPISSCLNFSRFLSKSCNVWLCFWSQQEEFHPQLSHMVEFMLIKICSIYPNICTRVFIIEENSIWIWALYRWQHDIVYVFLWLNILHKSADVNPSKFTRGIIITSGINFRY